MDGFTGTFRYECNVCVFGGERTALDSAFGAVEEHRRTEMHTVQWTHIDFDPPLAVHLGPEWVVECETCYQSWRKNTEADAEEFADRHVEVVGHEPDEIQQSDTATLDTESVLAAVRQLTPEFERGVPRPVLLHVLERSGVTGDELDRQLKRLAQRGDVYQPRPRRYQYVF